MQTQLALYLATLAGAIGVSLLMPRGGGDARRWIKVIGALLGAGALGVLWLYFASHFLTNKPKLEAGEVGFYYVFSFIAIASAVRVITHTRPVYAALWFVMVVISSAGLLLTLASEFMAFAMLIIYGGAILVTYMFVIMLATPPRADHESDDGPEYDRVAREPVWAVAAGFLLLAVVVSIGFEPMERNLAAATDISATGPAQTLLANRADTALATPTGVFDAKGKPVREISNTEHIGLDLFMAHPLAIELAGVILLLALIGAVVIAKTQVHDEDEVEAIEAMQA